MAVNYLYDTNIFIYHLNDGSQYHGLFDKSFVTKNIISISSITRIELLSFPDISAEDERSVSALLNEFNIVPLTRSIEDQCIQLRKIHKIKLPDAIIIATAIAIKEVIVTADREFAKFEKSGIGIAYPDQLIS